MLTGETEEDIIVLSTQTNWEVQSYGIRIQLTTGMLRKRLARLA